MIEFEFTSEATDVTMRVEVDGDGETTIVTRFASGGNTVELECEMPVEDLVAWFHAMEPAVRKYEDELAVDAAERVLSDYQTEQRLARQVFIVVTRRENNVQTGYTVHTKECRMATEAYASTRANTDEVMEMLLQRRADILTGRRAYTDFFRTLCLVCNPAGEATRRLKAQLNNLSQWELPEIVREALKQALLDHEIEAVKGLSS